MVDCACDSRGAKSIVDVDDRDTTGAAIEHSKQRGNSAKTRAIADTCWNRNHGYIDETANHARQGPFHASDEHDDVCGGETRVLSKKPMESGDPDVVEPIDAIAHDLGGHD